MVHRVTLLLKDGIRKGRRKLAFKNFFNSKPHRHAGLLALPPIQNQLFLFQGLQQVTSGLLRRLFFFLGQLHVGFSEEVENRQFLFREVFGDGVLVLLI